MALIVVANDAALAAAAADLATASVIAVDTEGDSFHSYWHRTCLLQISTTETDYVIDPLTAHPRPLAGIFADRHIEKIMHAAENDVRALKRDFAFTFCTLFDTMVAARILGYPRWGLADLLRDAYGVQLDKRFQRIDWAQRPLSRPALEYAAEDTHHLIALRKKLGDELCESGQEEESLEEFARLEETPAAERGFDPDDFWRVRGSHDLEPALRPVLRELYRMRDDVARRSNKPPFRVMPDSTLIAVARAAPKTQHEIDVLAGVSPYIAQRFGRGLLAAVTRAAGQEPVFPEKTRLDDAVIARYDALRAWRNARAAPRKVEGDVILPNSVLKALAANPPHDAAALSATGLLGPWKQRTYGEEIVALLNRPG
jgi:ribonuclease D